MVSRGHGGVRFIRHSGFFEVRWHQRDTAAARVRSGDPGAHHSPQLVHLILQGLCLLGQTGQCLVPLLQLRDLPLQLGTVQTLIFPAVLQPGGSGAAGKKGAPEGAGPVPIPGPGAQSPARRT